VNIGIVAPEFPRNSPALISPSIAPTAPTPPIRPPSGLPLGLLAVITASIEP